MDHHYLCGIIQEIEIKENIKILYACESGSRAWGFPSLDSDYDIRFIYQRRKNDYLSVFSIEEDIKYPIVGDLDIYGWDIRKVLKLLYKSNCTLYEWLQSPICYGDYSFFKNDFITLLDYAPNLRAHMHHYLGLCHRKMEGLDQSNISLKEFLYIARSLLSALWIETNRSYAPMEMKDLMRLLPSDLIKSLESIIMIKASVREDFIFSPDEKLCIYMKNTFKKLKDTVMTIPALKMSVEPVNSYFIDLIRKEDDDN